MNLFQCKISSFTKLKSDNFKKNLYEKENSSDKIITELVFNN